MEPDGGDKGNVYKLLPKKFHLNIRIVIVIVITVIHRNNPSRETSRTRC